MYVCREVLPPSHFLSPIYVILGLFTHLIRFQWIGQFCGLLVILILMYFDIQKEWLKWNEIFHIYHIYHYPDYFQFYFIFIFFLRHCCYSSRIVCNLLLSGTIISIVVNKVLLQLILFHFHCIEIVVFLLPWYWGYGCDANCYSHKRNVGLFLVSAKYSDNDSAMTWNPAHQQHWLIVCPLLRRTELFPVFSRSERWVGSLDG